MTIDRNVSRQVHKVRQGTDGAQRVARKTDSFGTDGRVTTAAQRGRAGTRTSPVFGREEESYVYRLVPIQLKVNQQNIW